MKRTYRIALFVEGTFARKVNAKAEAKRLLHALRVRDPWTPAGTKVTSKATPERSPAPKEPTERERTMADALSRFRRILEEVRTCSPMLARVTVRWVYHGDGGCGAPSRRFVQFHTHRGISWTRRPNGRKYVRLPRNLICLERALTRYAYTDEQLANAAARAVLRVRKKMDHREVFLVVERWKAWKAGTFTPPQPQPPPRRP